MLDFKTLWKKFPEKSKVRGKCHNKQNDTQKPFSNYCAILMSEALIRCGVSTASFKGTKCWSHDAPKHALLAEQLAKWLNSSNIGGLGKVEKINPKTFQKDLDGKTGIIFFKDYWSRGNESFDNRSGDHIDLWNKDEMTGSSMFIREVFEFFGQLSDLNDSKEVWFWEVK